MSEPHAANSIILWRETALPRYNPAMEHARLTGAVDRVISVALSEEDWKAFVATTPQPVTWLRERIQEAIARSKSQGPTPNSQA